MSQTKSLKADWFDLSTYNTLAVPAKAKQLRVVASAPELVSQLQQAQVRSESSLILGEGSNSVFVDDYDGTVIVNRIRGVELVSDTQEHVLLNVGAGENWHEFVAYTVSQGWYGLENLALIPGSVGAAPIQNIGAYGAEVKSSITQLEVYDSERDLFETIAADACEFGYRDSRFKHDWSGRKIITAVQFRLRKHADLNVSYPALRDHLSDSPTLKEVFKGVVAIRREKLPSPDELPNAGSFFKNPIIDGEALARLRREYPDVVSFAHGDQFKVAAAWLIDQAGWKSKSINEVSVHQRQALVLVNPERKSGSAILAFARAVQRDVCARYSIELEIEPRLIKSEEP